MSRSATTSVSLFPFLAVLVCAMGALIFLLLVTTRRIRSDALAQARTPVADAPADAFPGTDVTHTVTMDTPTTQPSADSDSGQTLVEARVAPQDDDSDVARPAPEAIDPNELIREELEQLASRYASLKAQVKRERAGLAGVRRSRAQSESRLRELKAELAGIQADVNLRQREKDQLERKRSTASDHVRKAESDLKRRRTEFEERGESEFAFMPFDGPSGTTRRPIYVECVDNEIRFLPESVAISISELDGFVPQYNPVLAGAKALVDFWSDAKSPSPAADQAPYVLLLVRPSGTPAFYMAQRMLKSLNSSFGYELLAEDGRVRLADVDPRAQVACRDAVYAVLAEKERVLASLGTGSDFGPRRARISPDGRIQVTERAEWRSGLSGRAGASRSGARQSAGLFGNGNAAGEGLGANRYSSSLAIRRQDVSGRHGNSMDASGDINTSRQHQAAGTSPNSVVEPLVKSLTGLDGRWTQPGGGGQAEDDQLFRDLSADPGIAGATGSARSDPEIAAESRGEDFDDGSENAWFANRELRGRTADRRRSAGPANPGQEHRVPANRHSRIIADLEPAIAGDPSGHTDGSQFPRSSAALSRTSTDRLATARRQQAQNATAGTRDRTRSPAPSNGVAGSSGTGSSGQQMQSHRNTRDRAQSGFSATFSDFSRQLRNRKRFGGSGGIGFEREVTVRINADQVNVAEKPGISVARKQTRELVEEVAAALEEHMQSWSPPPRGFHWVPTIRFVTKSSGLSTYERLRGPLEDMGVSSVADTRSRSRESKPERNPK